MFDLLKESSAPAQTLCVYYNFLYTDETIMFVTFITCRVRCLDVYSISLQLIIVILFFQIQVIGNFFRQDQKIILISTISTEKAHPAARAMMAILRFHRQNNYPNNHIQ